MERREEPKVLIPERLMQPEEWAFVIEIDTNTDIVLDRTNLIILNGNKRLYIGRDEPL